MHTLQWQVVVLPTGHIIDFSQMFHGWPNDKSKYDLSNLQEKFIGKPYALMGDSGYQGINKLEWATRPRGKQWCPPAPKEIVSGVVPHKRKRKAKENEKGKKCSQCKSPNHTKANCSVTREMIDEVRRKAETLTEEQKNYNVLLSKVRVVVENTISHLKRWRILKGQIRHFSYPKNPTVHPKSSTSSGLPHQHSACTSPASPLDVQAPKSNNR
jgi:hypothetical protein